MKPEKLSLEERSIVHEREEEVFLEIIKGMSLAELRSFDVYAPKNLSHYNKLQKGWLDTEKYLLQQRVGHEPTTEEFLEDLERYRTPERFRVWYVLHHPEKVGRGE